MTNLRSLILAAGFSFATIAMAHADDAVTGVWKLSIGVNDAPCTLNLVAGTAVNAGDATPSSDCGDGLSNITPGKATGRGVQLYSASDELIAWLNPKEEAYVGKRLSDGKLIALNR
jgi:type 1 fimbria pilin